MVHRELEHLLASTETQDEVKGRLLLDVVVREGSSILQLLSSEDQTLLLRGDAFLVLDLGLHVGDGIIWLNVQRDRLSGEGLDEDLHGTTSQTEDQVKSGLLLDVVVREGSSIFQLLTGEDKSLLLRGNSFLVLNLGLHIGNRVIWLDVQSNRLSREGLDEDLHGTTSQTEDQVKS